MRVLNQAYSDPLELEENAISILGGGVAQLGIECGMIWGASMAAGARAFRLYGTGFETELRTLETSEELVRFFAEKYKHKFCVDITHIDSETSKIKMFLYFLFMGGTLKCLNMGFKFSQQALELIDNVLDKKENRKSDPLPNCCTLLADKLELSDLHRTMISGLAGGIGLTGGGCGLLGAAVWLKQMQIMQADPEFKMELNNTEIRDLIRKFKQITGDELVCSKITGSNFADLKEHSDFLKEGGCREILDLLIQELH